MHIHKNLWWVAGTVLIFGALLGWYYYGSAWYRDRNAGDTIRGIYDRAGVREFTPDDEENIEIWDREARTSDEVMDLARTLSPAAIPGLVEIIIDKHAGGLARNWSAVVIEMIYGGATNSWPSGKPRPPAPKVDYDGLMRLAGDKTDNVGPRITAIELLALWKHKSAGRVFQTIINDPTDDTHLQNETIRHLGEVGCTVTFDISAVMGPGVSLDEKMKWMDYATNAELTDSQILELAPYIWETGEAVNIATRAIGGQKSRLATKVLGEALISIAGGERSAYSNGLLSEILIKRGDKRSLSYLENAVRIGAEHNIDALISIIWSLQEVKHPSTDELIALARSKIKKVGGNLEYFNENICVGGNK